MIRIMLIAVLALGWNAAALAQLCQLQLAGPMCRPCGGSGQAHIRSGGLCTACVTNCPPIVPIAPDGKGQSDASPQAATCAPTINEALARRALFYKLHATADELSRLAALSPSAAMAVNSFARHGDVIPAVDMRSGHMFAPGVPTAAEATAIITRNASDEANLTGSKEGLALKVEYRTEILSDQRAILTIIPWIIDTDGKQLHRADAAITATLALIADNTATVDMLARDAPVYRMTSYAILD